MVMLLSGGADLSAVLHVGCVAYGDSWQPLAWYLPAYERTSLAACPGHHNAVGFSEVFVCWAWSPWTSGNALQDCVTHPTADNVFYPWCKAGHER